MIECLVPESKQVQRYMIKFNMNQKNTVANAENVDQKHVESYTKIIIPFFGFRTNVASNTFQISTKY